MLNWHPSVDKVRKKFAAAARQLEEFQTGGRESLTRGSPLSAPGKWGEKHVDGMVIEGKGSIRND
jgi:hypothetical protein